MLSDSDDEYVPLVPSNVKTKQSKQIIKCYLCNDAFPSELDAHRHTRKIHRAICTKYSYKQRKCNICHCQMKSLSYRGLISHIVEKKCNSKILERKREIKKIGFLGELSLHPTNDKWEAHRNSNDGRQYRDQENSPSTNKKIKLNQSCLSCHKDDEAIRKYVHQPNTVSSRCLRNRSFGTKCQNTSTINNILYAVWNPSRSSARKANEQICKRLMEKAKRVFKNSENLGPIDRNNSKGCTSNTKESNRIKQRPITENTKPNNEKPKVMERFVLKVRKDFWDKIKEGSTN